MRETWHGHWQSTERERERERERKKEGEREKKRERERERVGERGNRKKREERNVCIHTSRTFRLVTYLIVSTCYHYIQIRCYSLTRESLCANLILASHCK